MLKIQRNANGEIVFIVVGRLEAAAPLRGVLGRQANTRVLATTHVHVG